jgi:hypothetical protein
MIITRFLTYLGLPALVKIISRSLLRMDNPIAKETVDALTRFEDAVQNGDVNIVEANRHAQEIAKIYADENKEALNVINKTIQLELQSEDKFISRMRPTFGYVLALTWFAQMMAVAYIIVFKTGIAYLVLQAVESLSVIWTIGLSVLGIYVYKRSDEKRRHM